MNTADKTLLGAIGAMAKQLQDDVVRNRLACALAGKPFEGAPDVIRQEVYRPAQIAQILHVSKRTISTLGKKGLLREVRWPGAKRLIGYTRESVERMAREGCQQ